MEASELLRSHDKLRAVVRLAGAELKKRNIGRKDSPLLQLMSRVTLKHNGHNMSLEPGFIMAYSVIE